MIDIVALEESYEAHERALHQVQLAMQGESNPVARRELMATGGRLAEKMEQLRNRINRTSAYGGGVYVNIVTYTPRPPGPRC